ncbi:MAG: heparinase [Magnetovibrio sp.]|nr:heparinase [Magnetovibrio sp.]
MVFRFARDVFYRSDIYNRMLRRHGTAQIHALGIDPLPGDPVRGAGILNGEMILAARKRTLGPHPFAADLKSRHAVADLYGFSWLRDLAALSAPGARETAQALTRDWLRHHDRWDPVTWAPGVTGARILAWLNHVDFVTESADNGLRMEMAAAAAAQMRHPARGDRSGMENAEIDAAPFTAGAALVAGAVGLPGLEALLDTGLDRLRAAVDRDLLADGGHRSRAPESALCTLSRLVMAARALRAGHKPVPEFLSDAIKRLAPAVKATVLGDGALAAFNGGSNGAAHRVAAILGAANQRGAGPTSLPDWGIERLQAGTTTVVADTGGHGGLHAGALSFELSSGRHRLVVNCGAHPDETTEWARVLRSTAAHSTLTVNDTDALPTGRPEATDLGLSVRRNEREGSSLVQSAHDGYRRAFGVVHNRDLYLSGAGDDFRGKDTLVGGSGAFTLRFHLHPETGASLLEGGDAVLLKLPGGKGWRFRCSGARPELEESVYLGDPARPRRCGQIVLRGEHRGRETAVRWSFLREGA